MGHYDDQYEEMYERQHKAKVARKEEIIERLIKRGYPEYEVRSFVDMCEAFGVWK